MLAILSRSWASTGDPGPLLRPVAENYGEHRYFENVLILKRECVVLPSSPLLPVLGYFGRLCWRSQAALGAYVAGLRQLVGPIFAVLAPFG